MGSACEEVAEMTYVLGVEPGHISGWCLFDGPKGLPLDWGMTGKRGRCVCFANSCLAEKSHRVDCVV